jgi:ferrous iron transport protein B
MNASVNQGSFETASAKCGCHGRGAEAADRPVITIVGMPNVGKSVMFNNLTGNYVTVSNYPGTTVEISLGRERIEGREFTVADTPGMYSLLPITEEEDVAREILLNREPHTVVHIVDAKNLERMLSLCLQLLELELPVVLALNMMDEAKRLGIHIDSVGLSRHLRIPVVETVATSGSGMAKIKDSILSRDLFPQSAKTPLRYDGDIENAIAGICQFLPIRFAHFSRGAALLLLQEDEKIADQVRVEDQAAAEGIRRIVQRIRERSEQPLSIVSPWRDRPGAGLVERYMSHQRISCQGLATRLSEIAINHLTGIPILGAIIYFRTLANCGRVRGRRGC